MPVCVLAIKGTDACSNYYVQHSHMWVDAGSEYTMSVFGMQFYPSTLLYHIQKKYVWSQ